MSPALLLALLAGPADAHSPNALSVRLHTLEQGEVVEVIAPSTAVQHALAQGKQPVELDSKAGKERWVAYLKQTLDLDAASGPITLGGGGIRVDSQQVVVRLKAQRDAGALYPLRVDAPVLADQPGQIVTFRVLGETPARAVLQPSTGYRTTLEAHSHHAAHSHSHAH